MSVLVMCPCWQQGVAAYANFTSCICCLLPILRHTTRQPHLGYPKSILRTCLARTRSCPLVAYTASTLGTILLQV